MPAPVIMLGAFAIACVPAAQLLASAQWPRRCPIAAIALWQALGLGWGLATVGVLAGFGAAGLGDGKLSRAALRTASLAGAGQGERLRHGPPVPAGAFPGPHPGGQVAGVAATAAERVIRFLVGAPVVSQWGLVTVLRLISLAAGIALLGLLVWILVAAIAAVIRARHRQRTLLGLLAHDDPKVPGALVVDHPAAAAYCVPGLRSAIVISAGALNLLDTDELAAVLAHERAHLRARHDLVLLPFTALLRAFRWSATARAANDEVALLVEMLADDRARRRRPARELATALLRVGASGGGHAPVGALAAADAAVHGELAVRVTRLLRPLPALPVPFIIGVGLLAALIVLAPAAALVVPL
ncbi:MAG TPA: M56 family metallopeptidase [Streptosporangiaceae bacterium]|nr:M56 family metallopeptidase [Streptosporangiaceae bacterium]